MPKAAKRGVSVYTPSPPNKKMNPGTVRSAIKRENGQTSGVQLRNSVIAAATKLMGSPDSTQKQKDAAMRMMNWFMKSSKGSKTQGAVIANLQEVMNEIPGEKVEFQHGIKNSEVMEKLNKWFDMPNLEPITPLQGQQTFVEGSEYKHGEQRRLEGEFNDAASVNSNSTGASLEGGDAIHINYRRWQGDDRSDAGSVMSYASANKESHGGSSASSVGSSRSGLSGISDLSGSSAPSLHLSDLSGSSGPASIADSHESSIRNDLESVETEVVQQGLNQMGQRGQNVVGRAAGDSGLGNAMKYDFVTAEGTGRMTSKGKNPGQVIQKGDQLGQRKRQGDDDPRKDPDAPDPDENIFGKNLTTNIDLLELQAKTAGSDKILDPIVYDSGRTSLRPQFLIGGEDKVRKTGEERMKMDVQFDMFDYVPEGFGLGAHNKMYVQEKNHDRLIRYNEPLYHPRWPDGAEITDRVFDDRLKTPTTAAEITSYMASEMIKAGRENQRVAKQQVRSVDSLADDNNTLPSNKGLRGHKPSPFEPVIRTASPWIPTTEPAGVNMRRQLKSMFNTQRTPQKPNEYNPNNGMATLDRKRAQEIILP